MNNENNMQQQVKKETKTRLKDFLSPVPLIGWLLGIFGAVLLEYFLGDLISGGTEFKLNSYE